MTYNVNGIRARMAQMRPLLDHFQPDIAGLQETKVTDEDFPIEFLREAGYHAHQYGQKTHYGVALLSKTPPLEIRRGFPHDEEGVQRRLITGVYPLPSGGEIKVINGYFPQGESRQHPVKFPAKRKFYADLLAYLKQEFNPSEKLIVVGDFNVSPEDKDVGIGEASVKRWLRTGKCSFLPEEREWMHRLFDWGLGDCYRAMNPEIGDRFSWFDYRTRGFEREPRRGLRIDFLLATRPLLDRCRNAAIDYEFRGAVKPSDHCVVWADFDL